MKRAFIILTMLLTLAGLAAESGAQDMPIVGNYRESSTTDPEVLAAARFAVAEASRKQGREVTLVSIERAENQLVAGMNYRLQLKVKSDGQVQDVSALVFRDLKQKFELSEWEPSSRGGQAGARKGRQVKIFLVALNDNGRTGRKIGCDDSLVPVTRRVSAVGTPLKAALEELLLTPYEEDAQLKNFWRGRNLRLRSVTQRAGVATIHITGEGPMIAGICDVPRIESQIVETARQFPNVRRVRVFVNGQTLASVLR